MQLPNPANEEMHRTPFGQLHLRLVLRWKTGKIVTLDNVYTRVTENTRKHDGDHAAKILYMSEN